MTKILLALNFKEIVVVEKTRSTWVYKEAEVALDEVKGLGVFIELEMKKETTPQEGKAFLRSLLV